MPDFEHRRLLRSLLLPVNLKGEARATSELKRLLEEELGGGIDEHFEWMESQLSEWNDRRHPSENLSRIFKSVILAGEGDYAPIISDFYFSVHKELLENQLVSFEQARSFLSHLILIVRLADEERMSSAQISKILDAMNPSVGFGRRSIEAVFKKMKIPSAITLDNIVTLFESDKRLSTSEFGDSELVECAGDIAIMGRRLGYKKNIGDDLLKLIDENDVSKYTPYLQILHYQCSILEYYDHNPKDFYEFSPRGQAALGLFHRYPEPMVGAENPFLNNAKSVGQVNLAWAAAKKNKEFPGAAALFEILDGLDEMGYAAKQELALWIRCFIHRFMIFAIPQEEPLPEKLDKVHYQLLIDNTAIRNTETRGIIEQRVVDAICIHIHPVGAGWVARGVGDSVNASNASKKKLGDCDFQKVADYSAVAYEAHGGVLTQTYVDGHVRTLSKAIYPRIKEWSTFSNPSDWSIKIVFVAHEFTAAAPGEFEIDGVNVTISFISYQQLIARLGDLDLEIFDKHVFLPLSQKRTPSFVRRKFLDFIEI